MAAPRSWKDLPIDLVSKISLRVRCPADRFSMSTACGAWCAAVLLRCRLHLPWLLLPYNHVADLPLGASRRARFFCTSCDDNHVVRVPRNTRGARFFGAYQGGWLFVAHGQNCGHALINLNGGHEPIPLPDCIASGARAFILAATLSAPPVPSGDCVAAAIVMTMNPMAPFPISYPASMAFWRMGSPQAPCSMRPPFPSLDLEDVIYHNGAFHFLTLVGNLYVCTPEFREDAPLEELQVRTVERQFRPVILGDGQRIETRYLVESRGELLMVERLRTFQEPTMTSSFRVFRMMASDADEYSWDELPTLDGRMLFVGHGYSRSYEAADFAGFQEGVYFHAEVFSMAQMIFDSDRGHREYPCSDNGIWSAPPDNVRCLCRALPSAYSSPVWFLH